MVKHAPEGRKEQYEMGSREEADDFKETCDVVALFHKKSKASWTRLIEKIFEVDPLVFPKCASGSK